MAKQNNTRTLYKLSASFCDKITKPSRYSDGGSLYLYVRADGRKSWIFRFRDRITGKQQDLGLGRYGKHDVTLAAAREAAGEARELLREFKNPITERNNELAALKRENAKRLTFRQCRDRYVDANKAQWRNEKHIEQWTNSLKNHAKPILDMPVADIRQEDVFNCLDPHWRSKTETMTRVRQRIEAILDWATVKKLRTGDNPARWRGHLEHLLPKPTKLKNVQHLAALPYDEMGAFMAELRKKEGLAAKAVELQVLTASRPGEVMAARWSEFNLETKRWTIPAERMKAEKEHEVPLSDAVIALIKSIPRVSGTDYVFPGLKRGTHMTTAAGLKSARTIKQGITAHGFRSSFRDWAGEQTAFPREVIEHALAHQLKDKAEASYQRGTLLPKRTKLMAAWANYCGTPPADNVTQIRTVK